MEKVFDSIPESMLENRQITVDVYRFDKSKELGEWFFKELIGYEKLQPKLEELKQVLKELEELRRDLLKVGYS